VRCVRALGALYIVCMCTSFFWCSVLFFVCVLCVFCLFFVCLVRERGLFVLCFVCLFCACFVFVLCFVFVRFGQGVLSLAEHTNAHT
jgi:hypothetical protein